MTQLTTVQFKKHKTAYTVAAVIALLGAVFSYFFMADSDGSLWAFFFGCCLLLSVFCSWNALSNRIMLEMSPMGIRHKGELYSWYSLRSYAILEEVYESGTFNYLVLNLKNVEVPLEIQLDWIDHQKSVIQHMTIYAEAFKIEFEGLLKKGDNI